MSEIAATPVPVVDAAPVPESAPAAPDVEVSLDDLMNADFGDDPVMTGTHKGIPDYKKILEHIPENGRKLVQNLRASYSVKTAEIAELRRQVEAERAELGRQRELLTSSEFATSVKAAAEAPLQHDAWSDEGLQERINKQAAEQMAKMLAPLQQDLMAQKRQLALESFKAEHPDLTTPEMRVPIAQLLVARPELKLEDAYHIVKGQTAKLQNDAARAQQRATLQKTSTGSAVQSGQMPKGGSAWENYQWLKANSGLR